MPLVRCVEFWYSAVFKNFGFERFFKVFLASQPENTALGRFRFKMTSIELVNYNFITKVCYENVENCFTYF